MVIHWSSVPVVRTLEGKKIGEKEGQRKKGELIVNLVHAIKDLGLMQ